MKKIIEFKLKHLARLILKKYKPEIIGITGSVGKTSTKEAIQTVLSAKFNVRGTIKNYNNEIGVPLTIIGVKSPGKSIFGWALVFLKATSLLLIVDKNFPKILVLEMGIDKPGDMDYLMSITKCNVGVVTLIGASHLEYFGTIKKIQLEKAKLIEGIDRGGWSILNYDNDGSRAIISSSKAKVITYGFSEDADVSVSELVYSTDDGDDGIKFSGVNFKINYKGSFVPVLLPGMVGYNVVYSALAAVAVAISYKMNLIEISNALANVKPEPGRMSIVDGIKRTTVIDDTYNSSPTSSISALDVFANLPRDNKVRRFAVLGDMLELGSYTEEGHKKVGIRVAETEVDVLIVVGEKSRDIARAAIEGGMSESFVFHFADAESAGMFLQERIKKGDYILVKGSQSMRMEKIVKEVMADPLAAKELLVRQDEQWEDV